MSINKESLNILITGAAGDIAQSIAKIFKENSSFKIIGTDLFLDHAGKFYFDKMLELPICSNNDYFLVLKKILTEYEIDILIPTSEPEIKEFKKNGIQNIGVTQVLSANELALDVGFDKLKTNLFLEELELPFPRTKILRNVDSIQEKKIIKSRFGSGSKNIEIISSENELLACKAKYNSNNYIVQEYIEGLEYTCGLFRTRLGEKRSIIFRRELMPGGVTGKGEVIQNDIISHLLDKIADNLDLTGSINVQLRMKRDLPYVFEINPRFSSTVYFRHRLGFEDVIWSIQDRNKQAINTYSNVPSGKKFYRTYTEHFE